MLQVAAFGAHMAKRRRQEVDREAQMRVIVICEIGEIELKIDCSLLTTRSQLE